MEAHLGFGGLGVFEHQGFGVFWSVLNPKPSVSLS